MRAHELKAYQFTLYFNYEAIMSHVLLYLKYQIYHTPHFHTHRYVSSAYGV